MINHIHIVGASGSGTTTLGKQIQKEFEYKNIDTDDYFWELKYLKIRDVPDRIELLQKEIEKHDKWVLSGSLCGWGDSFIQYFDLVIFIIIPKRIRMERLKNREYQRYGDLINPGNEKYNDHLEFMNWASLYDDADENVRSKKMHLNWISRLPCKVFQIEGENTISEEIELVRKIINKEES